MVMGVLDKAFDIFVLKFGVTKRVHLNVSTITAAHVAGQVPPDMRTCCVELSILEIHLPSKFDKSRPRNIKSYCVDQSDHSFLLLSSNFIQYSWNLVIIEHMVNCLCGNSLTK